MRDRIAKWLPWMLFVFIAASSGTMVCRNYIWDGSAWVKQTGSTTGYQGSVIYNTDALELLGSHNSGVTVVNKIMNEPDKWGLITVAASRNYVNEGRAFRGEWSGTLDSGETKVFHSLTSGDTVEIQDLQVNVISTSQTSYSVYLEPTMAVNGTDLVRPKNPHIQFIGGYSPTFGLWRDPTITDLGVGPIRGPIIWGSGSKTGGSKIQEDVTTLSPNQKLAYVIESFTNENHITVRFDWNEVEGGVVE